MYQLYTSMYDHYFNDKVVTKGIESDEMTEENIQSYMFRIINFLNEKTDLNKLKALRAIYRKLDLKNIDRIKSSTEAMAVALDIVEIMLDQLVETNTFNPESVNKDGKTGKCCDPRETRFKMTKEVNDKYKGKKLGNHGNIVMYSLQAIKHITSIDGGLLLSPHRDLYKRSKLLRWYGIDRDDNRKDFRCEADIEEWGFKFHMNDVCATVGNENLKCVNDIISRHQSNAKFYDKNLTDVDGLTQLSRNPEFDSAFRIYSTLVDNRDDFYKWMNECGIDVERPDSGY